MLSSRKKETIVFQAGGFRDLLRRQPAVRISPAMNHGVKVIGPMGKRSTKVAMANIRKRDHGPADPWDPVLRHLPDHHGIPLVAGFLVAQNGAEAPDHSPAEKIMDPP